jgi:uncharacterized metal-binding protein
MDTDYQRLYSENDRRIMKVAEDSLNPGIDRVDELIAFAKEASIKKIGIANCISFQKEADKLQQILESIGFKVLKTNCKLGRLPFVDILPGYKGVSCNPAGQAEFLNSYNTELNIVLGLCVGHDIIFNSKSKALTTTLIVKDRKLNHNTLKKFKHK